MNIHVSCVNAKVEGWHRSYGRNSDRDRGWVKKKKTNTVLEKRQLGGRRRENLCAKVVVDIREEKNVKCTLHVGRSRLIQSHHKAKRSSLVKKRREREREREKKKHSIGIYS